MQCLDQTQVFVHTGQELHQLSYILSFNAEKYTAKIILQYS